MPLKVEVDSILRGSTDKDSLVLIGMEELWLALQLLLEDVDGGNYLSLEVQAEDSVNFSEKNGGSLLRIFSVKCLNFEMEIHAHLLENIDVLQNYSVGAHKLIALAGSSLSFVHEKLVGLLLAHDQVFTADDGHVLFVLALLYSNNFVWLPSFCFQQLDIKFTNLLECVGVVQLDLVYLRHHESLHCLQLKPHGSF